MSRSFNFSLQNKLENAEAVSGIDQDDEGKTTIKVLGPLTDVRLPGSTLGFVLFVVGIAGQIALVFALPKGTMDLDWGQGTACWFVVLVTYVVVDLLWMLNPWGQRTIVRKIKEAGGYYKNTQDPLLDRNDEAKTTNMVHCVALMAMVRATSIHVLVVDPAVSQRDAAVAAYRGFVLGWAAYALYTAMAVVQVEKFPVELLGLLPLTGGVVSMIAALAGAGVGLAF